TAPGSGCLPAGGTPSRAAPPSGRRPTAPYPSPAGTEAAPETGSPSAPRLLGGHWQRHRHLGDVDLLAFVDVGVVQDEVAAAARFGHRPVDDRIPLRVFQAEMPGGAAGHGIGR